MRLFCKKEEKKHDINYILFENGRKIFTMQNVAFCIAKDGILHAERWPFGRQLTVFWKLYWPYLAYKPYLSYQRIGLIGRISRIKKHSKLPPLGRAGVGLSFSLPFILHFARLALSLQIVWY